VVKRWQDVSVLIVGCGSIGKRHARVRAGLGATDLRACDPSPEQRWTLVTGAAGGIGKAIADRLAAGGSRVVYADRIDATTAAARSPGALALRMDVINRLLHHRVLQLSGITDRADHSLSRFQPAREICFA
jgi:lactate dehydrogenase-like 2-hydroxyacid dehydrogenase